MRKHLTILPLIILINLNNTRCFAVEKTITIGTNAGFVNTTGEVAPPGTIPFQIDVNQVGGATGTMPFDLPAGFAGITPQLALAYSNYAGLGNFGIGCSLSGLSAITRTGQSYYYDGNVTGITFTNNDRFMLDGQRLIVKTLTNGANGATYATESDNLATSITSYGTVNNAPNYFKLVTKDGTEMLFGYSDAMVTIVNSGLSTVTLAWPIKKITDKRGNYIEFNYSNTSDGQVKLTSIKYTGNSAGSISPQYMVSLTYQEQSDPEYSYVGGRKIKNSLYITDLRVSEITTGTELNKYVFNYSNKQLTEVNKFYKGQLACKPTTFIWNQTLEPTSLKQYSEWEDPELYVDMDKFETINGDVNADGLSDIVKISRGKDRKWVLYTNINGTLTQTYQGLLPEECIKRTNEEQIIDYEYFWDWGDFKYDREPITVPIVVDWFTLPYTFFDIDRDGSLELCLIEANKNIDPDNYHFRVYKITTSGLELQPAHNKDNIGEISPENNFFIGNFAGNGQIDLVPFKSDSKSVNSNNIIDFSRISDYKTLALFELNGESKTEILSANKTSIKIYGSVYSSTSNKYVLTQLATITGLNMNPSNLQIADFNGDGLSDILLFNLNTKLWNLYLNNGLNSFILQDSNLLSLINTFRMVGNVYTQNNVATASPEEKYFRDGYDRYDYKNAYNVGIAQLGSNPSQAQIQLLIDDLDQRFKLVYCNKYYTTDLDADGKSEIVRLERDAWFESENITDYNIKSEYRITVFKLTSNGIIVDKSYEGPTFSKNGSALPVCNLSNDQSKIGCLEYKFSYLDPTRVEIGDYNEDGFPELVVLTGQSLNIINSTYPNGEIMFTSGTALQFYQGKPKQFLQSATDGLGMKTTLTYSKLNQGGIYSQDSTPGLPSTVHEYLLPIYVINNKTISNTIKSLSNKSYSYTNLRMHDQKGIMSFKTMTVNDAVTKQKTITTYDFNTTYFTPYASQIQNYYNSILTGKTQFEYTFVSRPGIRFYQYLKKTIETNPLTGNVVTTTLTMDQTLGNLTKKLETYGSDGSIETQYLYYTTLGKPQQIVTKRTQGGSSFSTIQTLGYDSYGNTTKITDNLGLITDFYYSGSNKTVIDSIVDNGLGTTTTMTYDATKRFVMQKKIKYSNGKELIESFTYDSEGRPLTQTDINGQTTTIEYDSFGQLAVKTLPDGRYATNSYGWQTSTAQTEVTHFTQSNDDLGNVSITYFDAMGRQLTQKTTPAGNVLTEINNYFLPTGHIDHSVSTSDGTTTYTYKTDGRIATATSNGRSVSYNYSALTVSETINGITRSKVHNSFGQVKSATDPGGTITYTYHPSGQIATIKSGGLTTTMEYDTKGRQTKLIDPNAGTTTYTYDNLGRLFTQTDPNNNITQLGYDVYGRNNRRTETGTDGTTRVIETIYDPDDQHFGYIQSETDSQSGIFIEYNYDSFGQLTSRSETIEGEIYTFSYGYNSYGQVTKITYPDGLVINQAYSGNYLKTVTDAATGVTLINNTVYNKRNQVTSYSQGNGNMVNNSYDSYGYLTQTSVGPRNARITYGYDFNETTQNLDSRSISETATGLAQTEYFSYDNLDRLATWTVSKNSAFSYFNMNYSANGNIVQKPDMGFYGYSDDKPHAVNTINQLSGNQFITRDCQVTYNTFNKANKITLQNGLSLLNTNIITYGPDNQRRMMTSTGSRNTKTIYTGLYQVNNGTERLHYVSGPDGLAALIVTYKNSSTRSVYYLHTDYQGSLVAVYSSTGSIYKQFSYDPWGRRRNPANWADYTYTAENLFTRGYTGHEHLDDYGLINMNGRIYDPRLGRFLSPDPFVQDPGNTQSFNRFTYCLNNPLKYTDPSGYKWRSWWDHWLPVIAIATVGIVASVVTLGALAPVGASAIFAASIVAGGVSGLITGMATAYINGGSLRDVLQAGVTGSIMGMMTAVATAGISALVSKIPVVAKFNWGRLVYTSNSKLVTEGGWHLFSGGVFKNAGDVLSNVGNMLDNIMSSSVQTGLASGVTSSFTASAATNVFTTSGLTGSLNTSDLVSSMDYSGLSELSVRESVVEPSYYDNALTFEGTPYLKGGMTKDGIDCSGLVNRATGNETRVWTTSSGNPPGSWGKINVSTSSYDDFLLDVKKGDLFVWPTRHAAFYAGGNSLFHAHGQLGTKTGYTANIIEWWLPNRGYPNVYRQLMINKN